MRTNKTQRNRRRYLLSAMLMALLLGTGATGGSTLAASAWLAQQTSANQYNLGNASAPLNTSVHTPTGGFPVISEFRTRGPDGANDEFIELYNPFPVPIDISDWEINRSDSAGATDTILTVGADTDPIPAYGYFLATNSSGGGYSGPVPGDQTYAVDIANNGGIALLDPFGTVVDQVGISSGSAFVEGTPLTLLLPLILTGVPDQSYERVFGGMAGHCVDTADNQADFQVLTPSNPQNLASAPVACAAGASIAAHLTWELIPQPNARNIGLAGILTMCAGGVSRSRVAATDATGSFVLSTGLPDDIYNWRFKGRKNLATSGTLIVAGGTGSPEFGLQRAGDANNDNIVGIQDFSILSPRFGFSCDNPGYDERADFNANCAIDAPDFSVLPRNFGMGGAPVNCP